MNVKIRTKSQITIPKEIMDKLGLKEGNELDIKIENNKILLRPMIMIPKDQSWFWTKEWQEEEKEIDKEKKEGKIKKVNNINELMEDLNK